MSQLLPAQHLRDADYRPVEDGLVRFITALLFEPLARIWQEEVGRPFVYENSVDSDRAALLKALRAGRLQYSVDARGRGVFSGESSAVLGRALRALGADFDHQARVYRLKPEAVPPDLLRAAQGHTEAVAAAHKRMDDFLRGLPARLGEVVGRVTPVSIGATGTTGKIELGFSDATDRVAIDFKKPDAGERARLAANYTQNLKLWIKKWAAEDIPRLRQEIEANVRSGARASALVDRIATRYKVAQSKARFLARQESGLFMSEYHKERYIEAGVPRYVWRTSKDCDVRDTPNGGHRALEGRVFSWHEGAPAKHMSNGKNNNPSSDFQCRCVAQPLVDTAYNAKFKIGDHYKAEK